MRISLEAALKAIASPDPVSPGLMRRLNRVPLLRVRYDMRLGPILIADVIDDPLTPTGERPRCAFLPDGHPDAIKWYTIAQTVDEHVVPGHALPYMVGKMYAELTHRLLENIKAEL